MKVVTTFLKKRDQTLKTTTFWWSEYSIHECPLKINEKTYNQSHGMTSLSRYFYVILQFQTTSQPTHNVRSTLFQRQSTSLSETTSKQRQKMSCVGLGCVYFTYAPVSICSLLSIANRYKFISLTVAVHQKRQEQKPSKHPVTSIFVTCMDKNKQKNSR